MKLFAIILFVLTYIGLIVFQDKRAHIALGSALIYVIAGVMSVGKAVSAIDWNVILMISGTMGTVYIFIESKMPALIADVIMEKTPNVEWTIISLSLFAGIVSAFIDNVATVLMIAPVAVTIAKKLDISPVPSIIAISIASNLQGAATLVGDTTSIILGGYAGLDFMDFFFFRSRPSLFFIVQAGALCATGILIYLFRDKKQKIERRPRTKIVSIVPTYFLVGTIVALIVASFIPNKPDITNGVICIIIMLIAFVWSYFHEHSFAVDKAAVKSIDFQTILLLAGLFVVVGSLTEVGAIEDISKIFFKLSGNNLFLAYTLIVWGSVIISAFIDNIPYIATMLPVVSGMATMMGVDPYVLYFGLICGATLGGNLTPIGASANITSMGILKKEGYNVKSSEFMKISIPFTLTAVVVGYILVWVLFA